MYKIIDGKEVSASVRNEIRAEVEKLCEQGKKTGLAVVIVGNNPASRVYVNNKKKGCEEVGMESFEYALPEETTTEELLELVEKLNNDDNVDGILCQLPLPKQIDENSVGIRVSVNGLKYIFRIFRLGAYAQLLSHTGLKGLGMHENKI